MIALVTTSRSFLALDLESGVAKEIHTGNGLYFGITYGEDLIFVAARNNYDCFEYLDNLEHYSGSVLVFDNDFNLTGQINMPTPTTAATLRDLHQIMFFDGRLLMTCALDNMVNIRGSGDWEYWFPSEDRKDRWKDIHHFNSLWMDFDRAHIYILAHQRGPSEIWKFSYPDLELQDKFKLGDEGHNIWKMNNKLYTCSSKDGTVISEDGFELDVGNFTRGAAITNKYFVIGTSDIAERGERHKSSGAIHVYNTNWEKVRQINIKDFGQVNDIRIPGHFDVCHHWIRGATPDVICGDMKFSVEEG